MNSDSTIKLTPDLGLIISTPDATVGVRLTRLHAQVLSAALNSIAGVPGKGLERNAMTFRTVYGQAVRTLPKRMPVVRLGYKPRGRD